MGESSIRLIVSADDVGLDPGITEGALQALENGLVTSLSVLTARSDFAATAQRLLAVPVVPDLGVHLTLCEGVPVLPPGAIPSLVEADGRFPRRLSTVVRRLLLGRLDLAELEAEWTAQTEALQALGLDVSHLDGHKHVHLLPGLPAVAAQVALRCGVAGARVVRGQGFGPRLWVRAGLALRSAAAARTFAAQDLVLPDRVVGIGCAGGLTTERLVSLIAALRPGLTELVCHPGMTGGTLPTALQAEGLGWAGSYGFDGERLALCSTEARTVIEERGIRLVSWSDCLP